MELEPGKVYQSRRGSVYRVEALLPAGRVRAVALSLPNATKHCQMGHVGKFRDDLTVEDFELTGMREVAPGEFYG